MSAVITQGELRNNNASIMRRVKEGEAFVVTVHGVAVADLTPHENPPSERPVFATVAEIGRRLGVLPDWQIDRFRTEQAALDAAFDDDDDRDPWARQLHDGR
jgi:antitoxin (DNA-binding transcriptional repressor) of toxin-antitoxin stability system